MVLGSRDDDSTKATQASVRTLGIIGAVRAYHWEGKVQVPVWFGRTIDHLARRVEKVYVCLPLREGPPDDQADHALAADNIVMVPQPFYRTTAGAVPRLCGIARSYLTVCRAADALYVRGLCPYGTVLYGLAAFFGRRVCQRIVSDPIGLLRSHRRHGRLMTLAGIIWAWNAQIVAKVGHWLTGGAFICSGGALAAKFGSQRTFTLVAGPLSQDEFFYRLDTCQGERIRILLLSYIRPEKGVEYLIEAVARLTTNRPWELWIVGPTEHYTEYRASLRQLATQRGLADRIHWGGHVKFGPDMFDLYRSADVFVLPSLSEGAPRVLIEARANGLPVVATRVGGIPSTVRDGVDGLLVPPRDPDAIAAAIERLLVDGDLRRTLIRNGYETARSGTIERLVEVAWAALTGGTPERGADVPPV